MSRRVVQRTALFALCAGAALAWWIGAAAPEVEYPKGYRDWTHVKSMVIQEGHPLHAAFGGIHHVYANDAALATLRKGKAVFADGATFVFDLLEAPVANNAISEGARKIVGVMHKDSKKFSATGGWGFEGFKGDTRERAVTDAGASCWTCHQAQDKSDGVFTTWRQ